MYTNKGFPGCIGAVYCMHLYWKTCPRILKGQFHNPKDVEWLQSVVKLWQIPSYTVGIGLQDGVAQTTKSHVYTAALCLSIY